MKSTLGSSLVLGSIVAILLSVLGIVGAMFDSTARRDGVVEDLQAEIVALRDAIQGQDAAIDSLNETIREQQMEIFNLQRSVERNLMQVSELMSTLLERPDSQASPQ